MSMIVVTPSPTPSARYYYISKSNSGAFGWSPRLGEAERFANEATARDALASVQGSAEMVTDARILRVGHE